jgi:hypothetical protein
MPARLTFKLDPRVTDDPVPFDSFAEMVSHAAGLLAELDVARSGRPATRWVVRGLRTGSAVVEIEAVPLNPLFDVSEPIARDLTAGLSIVASEHRRPDGFTDVAWRDTQAMVRILQDGVGRLSIDAGPTGSVVLTDEVGRVEDEPELALTTDLEVDVPEAISTIEGALETVCGHDHREMHFDVWDVVYRRRVRCDFDPALIDDVRRGLLERVRVHGRVTFDRQGHPLRVVEVRSIHVLGRNVARPRPADLRGLVPDMTGGLGAVEWVRRIRDA